MNVEYSDDGEKCNGNAEYILSEILKKEDIFMIGTIYEIK